MQVNYYWMDQGVNRGPGTSPAVQILDLWQQKRFFPTGCCRETPSYAHTDVLMGSHLPAWIDSGARWDRWWWKAAGALVGRGLRTK